MSYVNSLGAESYCEPDPRTCFDSVADRDIAVMECQAGYYPDRGTASCYIETRITPSNQHKYDPCAIEGFPVCDETQSEIAARLAAEQATQEPVTQSLETIYSNLQQDDPIVQTIVQEEPAVPTIYDDPIPIVQEPVPIVPRYDAGQDDPEPIQTIYDTTPVTEPTIPVYEPVEEPVDTKEKKATSAYMVVGILGLVVVGGGAVYLMTRKKKKK